MIRVKGRDDLSFVISHLPFFIANRGPPIFSKSASMVIGTLPWQMNNGPMKNDKCEMTNGKYSF
jgi:hypothetical protein